MSRTEVRGIISSKQGLSCEGFYTLSNETARLRKRLYVSVLDGDKVFLPEDPYEHFPCAEIEKYYIDRMNFGFFQSVGAGGGEVVFSCEGDSSEVADEAAEVITRTLVKLDAVINQGILGRWGSAIPQKRKYLRTSTALGFPARAYRPEKLPARSGPPEPISVSERGMENDRTKVSGALEIFEEKKREALSRFGMLEGYDRSKAEQRARAANKAAQPARRRPEGSVSSFLNGGGHDTGKAPWKESPWR